LEEIHLTWKEGLLQLFLPSFVERMERDEVLLNKLLILQRAAEVSGLAKYSSLELVVALSG
jgi:hypothetical protein